MKWTKKERMCNYGIQVDTKCALCVVTWSGSKGVVGWNDMNLTNLGYNSVRSVPPGHTENG